MQQISTSTAVRKPLISGMHIHTRVFHSPTPHAYHGDEGSGYINQLVARSARRIVLGSPLPFR